METILAGDIGGTNSRLMLFALDLNDSNLSKPVPSGQLAPGRLLYSKKYMNQDFASFLDVVKQFLKEANVSKPPLTACIAAAGPVKDNRVQFTNRAAWIIQGSELAEKLNIKSVKIINDFLAVGYGLLTLNEKVDCVVLQDAPKRSDCPIACIGAGTGLGECFLTPTNNGTYQCFPCEGGHSEFAPRNDLEVELLNFLKHKFEQKHRVSVERVISGPGLVNIYEFLSQKFPEQVDAAVQREIDSSGDLNAAIIAKNYDTNSLCRQTMDIFISAYGSEAGVAGLKWLPYGGLYLTGGLTPKNMHLITDPSKGFMHALLDKGRVSGMLSSIPIFAVLVEDLGERGAHLVAFQEFQSHLATANTSNAAVTATPASCGGSGDKHCHASHCVFWTAALVAAAFAIGRYTAKA